MEFGEIVCARISTTKKLGKLDQHWVEVVWAGKAEGSDEHIGLDHRGARRFRAVRREPESRRWRREVIPGVAGCPCDMRPVCCTSPPDAAELLAAEPPQPDDGWADMANTPITASGRRIHITVAMVKKFGASMSCPRCQNGTGTHTHMHVERASSAVWSRRPPSRHRHPQLTWQLTDSGLRREAKSEAMKIEEEMQS